MFPVVAGRGIVMSSEPALHLLVVDDSDSLRQGAARLLERAGYVVTTAANGAEALVSLREQPPHLVLLDRRLPDIDGLEICRHVKADPATADILVIMVSGELIEYEAQASGLETGADGYIARPVKNRELLARVAAFARLARINLQWKAEVAQRRQLEASLEERVQLRTRELTAANQKLEESRRAAMNLMQDATLAQQRLAHANEELRGEMAERERVEAALRQSEQMFRTDFEESPVGRCLVSLEGRFLRVNAALCVMLGYTASESSLLTFIDVTHPEDRASSRQGVAELLTGQRQHLDLEKRYLTKAGQTVWGSVHVALRRTADGTPLHFSVVIQDVTARRQVEEALRVSEARLAGILRVAPTGIGVVKDRVIFEINQYALDLTGYTREELIGVSARLLYPTEEEFLRVGREKYRQIAENRTGTVESRWRCKDGTMLDVLLSSTPLNPTDLTQGVTFTVLDITARKRAEEAMKRALAEKEVLLKEVHHRVKNNLQVVSGLLDLQAERLPDPLVRQALKESQSRIKSIGLVHEQLYQSAGLARLDFKAYVQSLVAHLFHANLGKGQVVHLDLRMAEVTLDLSTAVPCGLLINELVTNALKHAFPTAGPVDAGREAGAAGGPEPRHEILLTWEDAGTSWRLTVGDNGPGLPAGFDWERTKSLGLRLVPLLARQLKGGVRLEPGPGCRLIPRSPTHQSFEPQRHRDTKDGSQRPSRQTDER